MEILQFLFDNGFLILVGLFWLVILGGFLYKAISPKYRKIYKVKAKVIDKCQSDRMVYDFVNRRGTVKQNYYTVCFDVDGVTKRFNVSPLAYDYLKKDMKGTLIYKGNNFIDFE